MYSRNWKNGLIIKLALGVAIIMAAGCTSSTEKTSEPIHTEAMASTPTPIPLPTPVGMDIPALLPCIAPAPTDVATYQYHLPAFSTTWSLPDLFIYSIAFGPNNIQWFATTNGVLRFENGIWTRFTVANGLPDNVGVSIQVAPSGMVWVLTQDGSISNFNGETWKIMGTTGVHKNPPGEYYSPNKSGMVIASNGDIWAIGLGGIFSFDGSNWKHHTITVDEMHLVEDYRLLNVETGFDGTIWFMATRYEDGRNVLFHYDGTQWSSLDMPRTYEILNTMTFPRDGSIWFGGNEGEAPCGLLAHYDGITWKTYSTANDLANDYINDVAVGPDGIWFTTSDGVYRYDGETFETISNINGYHSVAISPTGEVWLVGSGEVTRIPPMSEIP